MMPGMIMDEKDHLYFSIDSPKHQLLLWIFVLRNRTICSFWIIFHGLNVMRHR